MRTIPTDMHYGFSNWCRLSHYQSLFWIVKIERLVSKDVCSAITESLLPWYISFPTLREIIDGFKDDLGFPSVWEQSIDRTSPSSLHGSVQPITTTGKAGNPLLYC